MDEPRILHNSHDLFFRDPFGAVRCGQKIKLSLEICSVLPPDKVVLRLWKYGTTEEKVPMYLVTGMGDKMIFSCEITAPQSPGLLWYYFIVTLNGVTLYYGNNGANLGGSGQVYRHQPPSFQVTVYKKDLSTPHWFKDAVMYQIFVDRFFNGNEDGQLLNLKKRCYLYDHWEETPYYRKDPETGKTVCFDFFGGNLLGVMKKLPYLKDLGINTIYFNPIFEAPSNHKYDTADYKKIDAMFGDNELFKELCQRAGKMGISIILDGVFSHTGSDSIYFNKEGHYPELGAYQSKESPYYSWYTFYNYPHEYECWWGIDTLPNVNENDPSYQDFIIYNKDSVLRHWMKTGIKGWRLDVVDELPGQFVKNFRKVMKEMDEQSVLIGEVWEDASNKISYGEMREYLLGDELDSVMNYPLRDILLSFFLGHDNAWHTHHRLMSLYENYPREHFFATMNMVGTHDVPRVLTLLGDAPPAHTLSKEEQICYKLNEHQKDLAIKRLKMLSLFQMTFPGAPCIYYGDEVGMEGYGDPLCRGTYPWGSENKQLLAWYKKIIFLRNTYAVLRTGSWISLPIADDVYGYVRLIKNGKDVFGRKQPNNTALVLFNRSINRRINVSVDVGKWCSDKLTDIFTKEKLSIKKGLLNISLAPLEGKLLIKEVTSSHGGKDN